MGGCQSKDETKYSTLSLALQSSNGISVLPDKAKAVLQESLDKGIWNGYLFLTTQLVLILFHYLIFVFFSFFVIHQFRSLSLIIPPCLLNVLNEAHRYTHVCYEYRGITDNMVPELCQWIAKLGSKIKELK